MAGALRRPETYLGGARELACLLRCAAHYPAGVLAERPRTGRGGIDGLRIDGLRIDGVGPDTGPEAGERIHRTPVMLVHGYGHNRSGWWVMRRHLAEAGFAVVDSFNYLPLMHDVPAAARRLAVRIEMLRRATGSDKVHLVGHSLGGVLARWYVQELDGAAALDTAVTLGSPHEGTWTAWAAPGKTAAQMRPGSWVLRRLEASARPSAVRWVAFYSNVDELIQPSRSAMIRPPALRAVNILAKDHGHLSLMLSPRMARAVVHQLEAAEGVSEMAPLSRLPAGSRRATATVEARPGADSVAPSGRGEVTSAI